ncbi:MAG TPA: aldehyde dehydrogenase family protein [Conexibacter sp.]|jgi:aldehyde dehydrogenase (NAD+)|nr:aldehyde dehydrogenase family protein [Conexibacter sp.]
MAVEQQTRPTVRDMLYVDGAWVTPDGRGTLDVVEASTEQVIGTIPEGTPADARRAAAAARAAFDGWAATPVAERQRLLRAIADGLEERADELARTVTAEVGMPLKLSRIIQAGLPIASFRLAADLLDAVALEEEIDSVLIVREPVGVVGAITPWNYPLHQVACKVAPALAAGCTVVLKPSEVAPLSAFVLAEVVDEVGLPAGVFNLVTGTGPVVGEAIATDPDVDMVSFTGSTRAGKRVSELASGTVKRVALELGGKSPYVILDDADLAQAVPNGVAKAFLNSGQTCSALTRMIVPREQLPEVEQIAAATAAAFAPADPLGERNGIGPLVSHVQRERVRAYIQQGIEEGARLVTGGAEAPEDLPQGFYVRPTVFSDVTPEMTIAREEIFGPVLVLIPYDDEDQAVAIANDTIYGLAAGVWSGDADRAQRVARRLRAGQIEVNGGQFSLQAPFGGFKQSGNGRENGRFGLEEYLEAKALLR